MKRRNRVDVRQARINIVRAAGQSLHGDFMDLIGGSIEDMHEIMENMDDTTELLRMQGGARALRQLLNDISPRTGGQE